MRSGYWFNNGLVYIIHYYIEKMVDSILKAFSVKWIVCLTLCLIYQKPLLSQTSQCLCLKVCNYTYLEPVYIFFVNFSEVRPKLLTSFHQIWLISYLKSALVPLVKSEMTWNLNVCKVKAWSLASPYHSNVLFKKDPIKRAPSQWYLVNHLLFIFTQSAGTQKHKYDFRTEVQSHVETLTVLFSLVDE